MTNTTNSNINYYLNQKHDLMCIIKYIDSFNNTNINYNKPIYRFKYCDDIKCTNKARYGVLQNYPIYCHKHKEDYMFDVLSKKCAYLSCITQPTFGYINNKPIYCKKHSLHNMTNVKLKLCNYKNCTKKATYRYKYKPDIELSKKKKLELFLKFSLEPLFCRIHKTDKMINIYKKIKM